MTRKGWYEREEISKITHDWVRLNCKNITRREKELLQIVNERKLVRRDHLEIIHDGYRNVGDNRTSILNRSVKKLFEKLCIDKVHEEAEFMSGNLPAVLALDKAGAIVLGLDKRFRRRIKHTHKFIGNEKYVFRELPNNYPHIHGVNDLEVRTKLFCEEFGLQIVKWDLEEKNAKIIMFNERFSIIPDVFMMLRINNKPFSSFIEYDTGMEDHRYKDEFPTIRDKLEKYQKYKLSGSWKSEKWAKFSGFPLLLFVTEDNSRVSYVNDKGGKLGLRVVALHTGQYEETLKSILKPYIDL